MSGQLRILTIGLFAGTLDIADALIFNEWRGITPTRVLQYIASGVLGTASFRGGPASAGLGLAFHYLIALSWATLFYIASPKLGVLTRRPILSGLVYGGVIYLVMNFVVLPASRVPHPSNPTTIASLVNGILALTAMYRVACVRLNRPLPSSKPSRLDDPFVFDSLLRGGKRTV